MSSFEILTSKYILQERFPAFFPPMGRQLTFVLLKAQKYIDCKNVVLALLYVLFCARNLVVFNHISIKYQKGKMNTTYNIVTILRLLVLQGIRNLQSGVIRSWHFLHGMRVHSTDLLPHLTYS